MADTIEEELTAYAEERIGGRSPVAQALVGKAAQTYKATLGVLQRFGVTSKRFWEALEDLSLAVDAIQHGLPGDADYYFGVRQFEELVWPALDALGPQARHPARWPLPTQITLVGDLLMHSHTSAFSLEQRSTVARKLVSLLRLLPGCPYCSAEATARTQLEFCLTSAVAKVLFLSSERGRDEGADLRQPYDAELAREMAHGGYLKACFSMLTGPSLFGDVLTTRDRQEAFVVHSADRMVASLAATADPLLAEIAQWAARQPAVVRILLHKAQVYYYDAEPPFARLCVVGAVRLVGHLACAAPALLAALKRQGLQAVLDKAFDHMGGRYQLSAADTAEVAEWRARLLEPASGSDGAGGDSTSTQQQQRLSREEAAALPVRELKARLAAAGVDCGGCAEKAELVDLLLQSQGPAPGHAGSSASAGGASAAQRPVAAPAARQKCCAQCGTTSASPGIKLRRCAGCKEFGIKVYYCSTDCQRAAWPEHKAACLAARVQA